MKEKINIGDQVQIYTNNTVFDGKEGEAIERGTVYDWRVRLDDLEYINSVGFDSNELHKIESD